MEKDNYEIVPGISLLYTEEKLFTAELDEYQQVAKEILASNELDSVKKALSNPSAIALTTTKKEAGVGIARVNKTPRELFILYSTNQFVSKGVNTRAETVTARGYDVVGDDESGVTACKELVENSGGLPFIRQLSINTYVAGDGWNEKRYNKNMSKITRLKQVHPLTLDYKKDKVSDKVLLDKEGEPFGYVQFYMDDKGIEQEKDIPIDKIAHLKFTTLGDDFNGMSLLQSGYDTIVRLMNMEYSAAEAAVKSANPLIIIESNTKSPKMVAQWAQILGDITGRDQIYLPDGMEIKFLSPGQQNFNDYAEYFLDAVVTTTGVPRSVLVGSSSGSNRAESVVLTRHFYSSIQSDQQAITAYFNKIFEEYGKIAGFTPPKMMFPDIAEDAQLNAETALKLYDKGEGVISIQEAREMIGLKGDKVPNAQTTVVNDVKKSDMETWHPNGPGSPAGKQTGEKRKMEITPDSTYRDGKKGSQIK